MWYLFQRFLTQLKKFNEALEERQSKGKNFSIIVVAEGAISKEEAVMNKKNLENIVCQ